MAGKAQYEIWGYWAKNGADTHHNRKRIGTSAMIGEARQFKDDAEKLGWPTVCIFENDHIVEPAIWAGQQHPVRKIGDEGS
jgi:hypothetical protein